MRFAGVDDGAEAAPPAPWLQLTKADWMRLTETGIVSLVVLLALLFVLRPMMLRLTLQPQAALAGMGTSAGGTLAGMDGALVEGNAPGGAHGSLHGGAQALAGGEAGALSGPPDEELMMLANVEGALRASSVRRLTALVERHPQQSLLLLRNWIAGEGA